MVWGSDEGHYSGELRITPHSGASTASEVEVRIWFRGGRPGGDGHGPSDADINEGLVKALHSIENHVTGSGGKEEPQAAS